jgi:hypothetical protein
MSAALIELLAKKFASLMMFPGVKKAALAASAAFGAATATTAEKHPARRTAEIMSAKTRLMLTRNPRDVIWYCAQTTKSIVVRHQPNNAIGVN